ncbi:MAG: CarD family transcriptional regulator [Anaerolineae bacterium]
MYAVGSKVVHPFHGAGEIAAIQEKSIGKQENSYYVINALSESSMQLMVPVDKAESLGLRRVGKPFVLRKKLARLLEDAPDDDEVERNFRARKATLTEKLSSGQFEEVASAVRILFYMSTWRKLCMTDRRFIDRGKEMLAGELALACDLDKSEAMAEIEKHLQEMVPEDEEED